MSQLINTRSLRAKQARLAQRIGKTGHAIIRFFSYVGIIIVLLLVLVELRQLAYLVGSLSLALFMLAIWYKRYLAHLQPTSDDYTNRLSTQALGLLPKTKPITPQLLWSAYAKHWQSRFFTNRLLLHAESISQMLSEQEDDTAAALQKAAELSGGPGKLIDIRHITAALLLTSPGIIEFCKRLRLQEADLMNTLAWIERAVAAMHDDKPYYGGIGRDWASGFTPKLNVFGANISQAIQRGGAHFGELTKSQGVQALRGALSQGASMVALVGNAGAGKTSHVYALAQTLLAEAHNPNLRHRQIVGLDATAIISSAQRPGDIEHIVTSLLHEASHAGNIILFLDNADLFFEDGHGSFNATKLLQPIAQSGSIQVILAMTPRNQQELKINNAAFASSLTPVVLQEPEPTTTLRILQDTALNLEHKHGTFVTYQALKTAVPLSDRYVQD
ncbi:MAG: AAA family ATPase, partial [Actinobacteria bacterium]|nr:AAA family ATPase [Actinomycetota bacterium]